VTALEHHEVGLKEVRTQDIRFTIHPDIVKMGVQSPSRYFAPDMATSMCFTDIHFYVDGTLLFVCHHIIHGGCYQYLLPLPFVAFTLRPATPCPETTGFMQ